MIRCSMYKIIKSTIHSIRTLLVNAKHKKNLLTREEQEEDDDETNLCKYFRNIFME